MARGIWSGAISFGLINIPVSLMSANQQDKLHFKMLDKKDNSPIGYRQINKSTGKEVKRSDIVKGYEYERNQFVIVDAEDFKRANPKATQTIDIEDFVEIDQLDPLLFEKPYYLVPSKNGEKGYVLLREVLERTEKVAIARFVLRNKQHLVAVMSRGDYLILEVLRFANEIKEVSEANFLEEIDLEKVRITEKEIKMAESLVEGMTADWKPQKYKDTYQDDLLKRIEQKIKSGDVEEAPEVDESERVTNTNIVNLMPLLEKSLKAASRGKTSKTMSKATSRTPKSRTQRAAKKATRKRNVEAEG